MSEKKRKNFNMRAGRYWHSRAGRQPLNTKHVLKHWFKLWFISAHEDLPDLDT